MKYREITLFSALKQRFADTQQQMMQFLTARDEAFLQKIDAEGHTNEYYLQGIIDHNMYHLGQMGAGAGHAEKIEKLFSPHL